jgi:RNA polymerase sigma factor (sigma-70 family)
MGLASGPDRELARAAIGGDGSAFAELYDRHERRAFNLAYRITGSREDAADATHDAFLKMLARLPRLQDRELDFGSYLLTAVRHASYDVMARAGRAQPSDDLPESARPVGAAAAPPPEDEPDRNVLLAASQEEIRAANAALAPRQREALALRELEGLSYDEIAVLMAMNRNSVAQLISRARIALRDALRHTALRTIPPASKACEKALPLIAMRADGQLKRTDDAGWLDAHLASCRRCELGREAMAEAGASYRIWAPVAAVEVLRRETIAKAGARLGHDWSDVAAGPRTPDTSTPSNTAGGQDPAGSDTPGGRDPAGSDTPGGRDTAGSELPAEPQAGADAATSAQSQPGAASRRFARRRDRRSHDAGGASGRLRRGPSIGDAGAAGASASGSAASSRTRARRDGLVALALATLLLLALLAVRTADGEPAPPAGDPPIAEAAVAARGAATPPPAAAAPKAATARKQAARARGPRALTPAASANTAPSARPIATAARSPRVPARRRGSSDADRSSGGRSSVAPPPPSTPSGDTGTSVSPPAPPPPPPPADPPGGGVVTDPPPPPPPPPSGPHTAGSGSFVASPPPPPPPRPTRVRRPGGSGGSSVPVP